MAEFKNRYGVLETLSMGKVSKRDLKTTRDDFTRSVVTSNGLIDRNLHSKSDFGVNGRVIVI